MSQKNKQNSNILLKIFIYFTNKNMKICALHWPEIYIILKARPEIQQHATGKATFPVK